MAMIRRYGLYAALLALVTCPTSLWAQSWTTPTTRSTGNTITAAIWNTDMVDNLKVLRAGGFAVTSQAIGDLLCASSTTQYARLADVATGQVLVSGGVGACPSYSATLPTAVQDNITRLGTIASIGAALGSTYGGTGVNNGGRTLTINTNNGALTFSGAYTLTVPATGTAVLGTGAANRIAYWADTNSLTSSASFTYDGTTFTVGTLGTHVFSAGAAGGQILGVRNTTSGAANYSRIQLGNDSSAETALIDVFSTTYTTSGWRVADALVIRAFGAGGIGIDTENVAGSIRFGINGTEKWRIETDGNLEEGDGTVRIVNGGAFQSAAGTAGLTSGCATPTDLDFGGGLVTGATCSSTERVKENIQRQWRPPSIDAFKALAPAAWDYRSDYGGSISAAARKGRLGFIAEDAAATGLPGLVSVDEEGLPSGLYWTGVAAYQQMWLSELDARLARLEQRGGGGVQ